MEFNTSHEPMDVDLSANSVSPMDISYNEGCSEHNKDIHALHIVSSPEPNIETKSVKRNAIRFNVILKSSKSTNNYPFLIFPIVLILISYLYYYVGNMKLCSQNLDTVQLENLFSKRLFGQVAASRKIIEAIEDENRSKLIVLSGGTGVGKTLTVSLIIEGVRNFANVYHYTMPSFIDILSTYILFGFAICKSSIIVVDDIRETDIKLLTNNINNLFNKSQNLGKNMTIILVFNCNNIVHNEHFINKCDNSLTELKHNLNGVRDLKSYYIHFNNLNEEVLRKCIEYELGEQQIRDKNYDPILKYFDVSMDGCKNVHKKIKYFKF